MRIAIVTVNARLTEESNQNINTLFYSDYIVPERKGYIGL